MVEAAGAGWVDGVVAGSFAAESFGAESLDAKSFGIGSFGIGSLGGTKAGGATATAFGFAGTIVVTGGGGAAPPIRISALPGDFTSFAAVGSTFGFKTLSSEFAFSQIAALATPATTSNAAPPKIHGLALDFRAGTEVGAFGRAASLAGRKMSGAGSLCTCGFGGKIREVVEDRNSGSESSGTLSSGLAAMSVVGEPEAAESFFGVHSGIARFPARSVSNEL